MIAQPENRPLVVVVDGQPNDYAALALSEQLRGAEVCFVESGRAALRLRVSEAPQLWVVNIHLPDMSGLDLYEMLVQKWPEVPVYLVGDDYRPEDEIYARMSGATFYFCKPLEGDWLAAAIDEPVAEY